MVEAIGCNRLHLRTKVPHHSVLACVTLPDDTSITRLAISHDDAKLLYVRGMCDRDRVCTFEAKGIAEISCVMKQMSFQ